MDERSLIFLVIHLQAGPIGLLDDRLNGGVNSLTRMQFHANLFADIELAFAGFRFLLWHAEECTIRLQDVQV
jgi:hypothetical protein